MLEYLSEMNYETPFYVNGVRVSVKKDGKSVSIYHNQSEITEEHKIAYDNIIQYLMDEYFVISKKCRVDIYFEEE